VLIDEKFDAVVKRADGPDEIMAKPGAQQAREIGRIHPFAAPSGVFLPA
jgi:hypothetical protein